MADRLEDNERVLILSGNLRKVMWKLSLPSIASMVLFGLNTVSDAIFVGQLIGPSALSGVALAGPLTAIVLGFGYWIGTGSANVLSIALGANDQSTQQKILDNTAILTLVMGLLFALPIYFFAGPLISMMGGKGEALVYGTTYFKTTVLGSIFWIYGMSLNLIIRGEGKMKKSALMVVYGLLVNIFLTPFFIKVVGMGVEGAAWAINIGMLVFSIDGFYYFLKGKASYTANILSFKFDKEVGTKIIASGLPGFIFNIMSLIQAVVVFNVIAKTGNQTDMSFFAAANVIYLFLMTPLYGLMRAYQPVAGINFGAGEYQRLIKGFNLFTLNGLLLIAPFWVFIMLFPHLILGLIIPNHHFISSELWHFQVYVFVLPFLPLVFMALMLFPAINKSKYASMIVLVRQLVLFFPVMLLLPQYIGISGVYYGSTAVNLVVALWTAWLVWKEFKILQAHVQ